MACQKEKHQHADAYVSGLSIAPLRLSQVKTLSCPMTCSKPPPSASRPVSASCHQRHITKAATDTIHKCADSRAARCLPPFPPLQQSFHHTMPSRSAAGALLQGGTAREPAQCSNWKGEQGWQLFSSATGRMPVFAFKGLCRCCRWVNQACSCMQPLYLGIQSLLLLTPGMQLLPCRV